MTRRFGRADEPAIVIDGEHASPTLFGELFFFSTSLKTNETVKNIDFE